MLTVLTTLSMVLSLTLSAVMPSGDSSALIDDPTTETDRLNIPDDVAHYIVMFNQSMDLEGTMPEDWVRSILQDYSRKSLLSLKAGMQNVLARDPAEEELQDFWHSINKDFGIYGYDAITSLFELTIDVCDSLLSGPAKRTTTTPTPPIPAEIRRFGEIFVAGLKKLDNDARPLRDLIEEGMNTHEDDEIRAMLAWLDTVLAISLGNTELNAIAMSVNPEFAFYGGGARRFFQFVADGCRLALAK